MLLGKIMRLEGYCYGMHVLDALDRQEEGDNRQIGEILVERGAISSNQLDKALLIQRSAS